VSFGVSHPTLGMFGDPLTGLFFGGETLDHFRLAIRPKNIDHPAKSGIFSRHENGPVFRHPVNMCVRRTGSSQSRCLIRRGDAAGGNPVSSLFWPGPVVL
jgi:hypothetical protein